MAWGDGGNLEGFGCLAHIPKAMVWDMQRNPASAKTLEPKADTEVAGCPPSRHNYTWTKNTSVMSDADQGQKDTPNVLGRLPFSEFLNDTREVGDCLSHHFLPMFQICLKFNFLPS